MKNRFISPFLLLLLGLIYPHHAYPTEMTSSSGCKKALSVGSNYMGQTSVSSTTNSVTIKRGSETLSNGDAYVAGETLSVTITTLSNYEYLLEADGGALFEGGSCSGGTRVANSAGSLTMPQSGGGDVAVTMGFASKKGVVSITPAFTLVAAPVGDVTTSPSMEPTRVPSVTANPSRNPSPQPQQQHDPTPLPTATPATAAPTTAGDTHAPSVKPTRTPTSVPHYSPTTAPSLISSKAPSVQPSATPSRQPTPAPTLTIETMVGYTVSQTLVNIDEETLSESSSVVSEITTALVVSLTEDFITPPDSVIITNWQEEEADVSIINSDSSSRHSKSSSSSSLGDVRTDLGSIKVNEVAKQRKRSSFVAQRKERKAKSKIGAQVSSGETLIFYTVQYVLQTTAYTSVDQLTSAFDTLITSEQYTDSVMTALQLSSSPIVANITSTTVDYVSSAIVSYVSSAPPSWQPSASPGSSDDAFHAPLKTKLGVGIVFGSIGLGSFIGGAVYFMSVDRTPQMILTLKQRLSWSANIVCCVLAVVALILVSAWATNHGGDNTNAYQYLGKPEWGSNPLAWHPVLMVTGFFVAQTLLLNSSGWDTTWNDRSEFIFWATLSLYGFVTMVIALSAVNKYISDNNAASLTTMHSWIGVMAVILFLITSIWGMVENYSSRLVRSYVMIRLYRALKLSTYGVTVFAIVTGVVNYLPYGACNYVLSYYPPDTVDMDPAQNYEYLPDACKVANGLVIVVSLMGVLATLSLSIREELAYDNNGGRQHSRLALDDSKYLFSVNLDDYDD